MKGLFQNTNFEATLFVFGILFCFYTYGGDSAGRGKKNPQRRGGNGITDGSPGADDFLRQDLHFRPNALTSCVTDDVGVVCFSDKRKDNKIGIKAASISGLIFKQHKGKPLF